jgi:hypothetical protein
VNCHIDPAELIGNRPVKLSRSLAFLKVENGSVDIGASGSQPINRILRGLSCAVSDYHSRAFVCHALGRGQPDTLSSACHNRDLVFEPSAFSHGPSAPPSRTPARIRKVE